MHFSGPTTARVAIISDWHGDISKVKTILSAQGLSTASVFFCSLAGTPPVDEDITKWVNPRKTCPDPTWTHHKGFWVTPELYASFQAIQKVLLEVQPTLVITLGALPLILWHGTSALGKWRGSRLQLPDVPFTILPTIHPRTLITQPDQAFILRMDLTRAYRIFTGEQLPRHYAFQISPTFSKAEATLEMLLLAANHASPENPLKLSGDIETRSGYTACMGIAWSATDAICIPHHVLNPDNPFYWPLEEEARLVELYGKLFHHPNVLWVGQNYLYDCQYFYRHWGIIPIRVRDTMIGAHSLHSNIRKGLDFLSSMYAEDHLYWKDEIKDWDPSIGEQQYWTYNCKDACLTWEIDSTIHTTAIERGVLEHFAFQQSLFHPVLRMMNRGLRYDTAARGTWDNLTDSGTGLLADLIHAEVARQAELNWLVGHEINPKSPAQLLKFFYTDLGIPGIKSLASESLTTNSPALAQIAEREPILKPLCQLILELRSIAVFKGTFVTAPLDSDGRMRCSFSIAGPSTYRFASSENAFGSGMNLQNIPVAAKEKIKSDTYIKLPNIRKLFIPDPGYTFFDMDLDRADLQVVVWEADDPELKLALREGIDLHCFNAVTVYDIKGIPYDELRESHPNYKEHRGRIGEARRGKTKAGIHATNYGVGDRKLAQTLGISVHEASLFRAKWFAARPGIRRWHLRTEQSIATHGFIENKFGARLYNFGRVNLPEFLGWLPQSTVAGVINRGLVAIDTAAQAGLTSIQLQIQVHDSLAGQFLTSRRDEEISNLKNLARVVVPYPDPLVIPVGIKTSTLSWGDCK